MLPAAKGLISKLLLALPTGRPLQHERATLEWLRIALLNLVDELHPQASIYLLFAPGQGAEAGKFAEELQRNIRDLIPGRIIHPVPAKLDPFARIQYRIWIHDPFVVVKRGGVNHLLEPRHFTCRQDQLLAECLQQHCGMPRLQCELDFEGGNMLGINEQFAIVGPDTIETNRLRICPQMPISEGRQHIERQFAAQLGVQHVITPYLTTPHQLPEAYHGGDTGLQALYHLDLFITPCGQNEDGHELLLVGDIEEHRQHHLAPFNDDLRSLASALDQTADFFKEFHRSQPGIRFSVQRIPLLVLEEGGLHYHSWNNCLIENNQFQRRAYLPSYHTDDRHLFMPASVEFSVQGVFQRIGFPVTWVRGPFANMATKAGALHCMSQILERS